MNLSKTVRAARFSSLALATAGLLMILAAPAAAGETYTRCNLEYSIKGWSFVYKTGTGTGTITCADGQKASVKIRAHAGGLTLGTQNVESGRGRFSGTIKIEHLYGTYVEVGGHAGAGDGAAVEGRAMFKGRNRLSLNGKGGGFTLGAAIGGFTISPQ